MINLPRILAAAFFIFLACATPPKANAVTHCGVAHVSYGVMTSPAPPTKVGFFVHATDLTGCVSIAKAGAANQCFPAAVPWTGMGFQAINGNSAVGGTGDFCSFACEGPNGGCTFRVDLANGLPVELLQFGVE